MPETPENTPAPTTPETNSEAAEAKPTARERMVSALDSFASWTVGFTGHVGRTSAPMVEHYQTYTLLTGIFLISQLFYPAAWWESGLTVVLLVYLTFRLAAGSGYRYYEQKHSQAVTVTSNGGLEFDDAVADAMKEIEMASRRRSNVKD